MNIKKFLILAGTIIIFALAARYVALNFDSFKRIMDISLSQAFVLLVLQVLSLFVNGIILLILLKAFGVKLSFLDGVAFSALNTFLNYITIKGGVVAKGYFLKKLHKLSYTDFAAGMAALVLLNLLAGGLVGAGGLILMGVAHKEFNGNLFLIFTGVTCGTFSFIKLSGKYSEAGTGKRFLQGGLRQIWNSWRMVSENKRILWRLCALVSLNFLIYGVRFKYGYAVLYERLPLLNCVIIGVSGAVSTFFAITPASLGIREFVVGASYRLMDGEPLRAVVVTSLDRAVSIILVFALGIGSYIYFQMRTRLTESASGV